MDNLIHVQTNSANPTLNQPIEFTNSNFIKPVYKQKNSCSMGNWTCAVLLTSLAFSTTMPYELVTKLNYSNKNTVGIYSLLPSITISNFIDDEINNELFVKFNPIRKYSVKLNITAHKKGKIIV